MIKSFKCKETLTIWNGVSSRKFPHDIQDRVLKKLRMLDAAGVLDDLKNPPSNRPEKLKGDREGQMSIRVNDQWRICFKWKNCNAYEVELIDYHR